jgi:hypothetical protein
MKRIEDYPRRIYYLVSLSLALVWLAHLTISFGLVAYFCQSIDRMILHIVSGFALIFFGAAYFLIRKRKKSQQTSDTQLLGAVELFISLLSIATFSAAIVNFFMPNCQNWGIDGL